MTNYAFMTKEKFEQVEGQLVHGVRFSLDGSQVVAKLAEGQTIEGATIETYPEALQTIQGPEWTPGQPDIE